VKFHPAGSATLFGSFADCANFATPLNQLRAPALAAPGPVSRRSFTGPAGQPPRLRAARQTPTSAAGHERDRANFSPRTPANTGRPKLPPRKSPRPSPPSALMSSVDRRTAGRSLKACTEPAREAGRMQTKRHSPTIDHSSTDTLPAEGFGLPHHQQHPLHAVQQHLLRGTRSSVAPAARSRQFFDNRRSLAPAVPSKFSEVARAHALAVNRPKPPNPESRKSHRPSAIGDLPATPAVPAHPPIGPNPLERRHGGGTPPA